MVLVGGDGGELRLREDECLELLRSLSIRVVGVGVVCAPDEVEPRLVAVHGVEYHVAVVVQLVVRQLQLVEGHHLKWVWNGSEITRFAVPAPFLRLVCCGLVRGWRGRLTFTCKHKYSLKRFLVRVCFGRRNE